MATIQVQVNDELLQRYGREAVQQRLQRFLDLERLRLLALDIQQAVEEAGEDQNTLWQQARTEAWATYKKQLNLPSQ